MAARATATVRRVPVAGVTEVLTGSFRHHAYPAHVHDTWTILLVDRGEVRFRLGEGRFRATTDDVTVLPPGVVHDGGPATATGFDKRVVHLRAEVLDDAMQALAASAPRIVAPRLRKVAGQVHAACMEGARPHDADVHCGLEELVDGISQALLGGTEVTVARDPRATALRDLLEQDLSRGQTIGEQAALLGSSARTLARVFVAAFGVPPHRYLLSRRLEEARRRIAGGDEIARVAADLGFHDQPHLTRHFGQHFGLPPGRLVRAT